MTYEFRYGPVRFREVASESVKSPEERNEFPSQMGDPPKKYPYRTSRYHRGDTRDKYHCRRDLYRRKTDQGRNVKVFEAKDHLTRTGGSVGDGRLRPQGRYGKVCAPSRLQDDHP